MRRPEPPPSEASRAWPALLLAAAALVLAGVPDQKLLRTKFLALETCAWLVGACALRRVAARRELRRTPLDFPVLLGAAAALLFYALSPERGASALELNRALFCAAVFFGVSQASPLRAKNALLGAWTACAAAAGLHACLQHAGGFGFLDVPQLDRPFATFGNPIFLASYLAASLWLAAGLATSSPRPAFRAAYGGCAVLIAAGLLLAQSRAALAGLWAAGAAGAWLHLKSGRRKAALLALGASLVLALPLLQGRQWTHGLIWRDTLSLWRERPWLGCGLGRFHLEFPAHASAALRALWPQGKVIVNFAHNEYLQVLAETGLLGLGLSLFLPAVFLLLLLRRRRIGEEADPLAPFLSLACLGLWAQSLFSPDLRFGVSSFILYFLLAVWVPGETLPLGSLAAKAWALAGAAFLWLWGALALAPVRAFKRLEKEPPFHVEENTETRAKVELLKSRLGAHPEDADAAENLAYVYARERRWKEAAAAYEAAVRLAPGRPGPYNNLGNIYYSTGDPERAILYWRKSLEADPRQTDAHLNLGKTLYELGRLKESAAHLESALRLDPANEKARVLLKKMVE